MPRLLLVDADAEHADSIMRALRSRLCTVSLCNSVENGTAVIAQRTFDAVIVSLFRAQGWDFLVDRIRHAALRTSQPPQVICLLRGPYRGPAEKVHAARKGFRVVYER